MVVLHLGLLARRAGVLVRGTFAGPDDHSEAIRLEAMSIADRAASAKEILDSLSLAAERRGFVLETGRSQPDEVNFYLWHPGN